MAEIISEYLKSTMGKSRLYGLAQMSIDRDLPNDPEKVVDKLARKAAPERHTLTNLRTPISWRILVVHACDHSLMD